MKVIKWCMIFILALGGGLWCIGEGNPDVNQIEVNNQDITEKQSQGHIKKEGAYKKESERDEMMAQEDKLEVYIDKMSLEEKIGQIFIVGLDEKLENRILLEKYHVGGIVLFKKDIESKQQVKNLVEGLQQISKVPLWIAIDEEGGRVSRIGHLTDIEGTPFKSAYEIGQTKDVNRAYSEAKKMGQILYNLGVNMDFAPVADIYNNESNTVIGDRSFGHTKEEVIPMVIAFAKGLKEESIFPVIKHFPGHGNTYQDSHKQLAYIDKTLKVLEQEEMVPFFESIRNGVEGMMVGHLVVPEVDGLPATLSPKWGAYMKDHLDKDKVLLITDAMNMGAIIENREAGTAAVESFLSGMDIILMPDDLEAAEEAMLKAYEDGRITSERLNESVKKILLKKVEQNVLVIE